MGMILKIAAGILLAVGTMTAIIAIYIAVSAQFEIAEQKQKYDKQMRAYCASIADISAGLTNCLPYR